MYNVVNKVERITRQKDNRSLNTCIVCAFQTPMGMQEEPKSHESFICKGSLLFMRSSFPHPLQVP
jgi:hypothetical protein